MLRIYRAGPNNTMNEESGKIIFLDFDGVLASSRASKAVGEKFWRYLDPLALRFIERMCQQYYARVVISSTWRIGEKRSYFNDLFSCSGFGGIVMHTDAMTKNLSGNRGDEIKDWLDRNGSPDYVIIDDDSDMLPEQKTRFVHTDPHDGMLFKHYLKLEGLITGEDYTDRIASLQKR